MLLSSVFNMRLNMSLRNTNTKQPLLETKLHSKTIKKCKLPNTSTNKVTNKQIKYLIRNHLRMVNDNECLGKPRHYSSLQLCSIPDIGATQNYVIVVLTHFTIWHFNKENT